jgi:ribosome-binding factor A
MERLRVKRVERLIKELISKMILQGEIKDPRIDKLISIYEVELSNDIKYGKVYTSYYGETAEHEKIVLALNHAAGYIQRQLGKKLHIKTIPRLTFILDKSIERGFRITQKLKDLSLE